MGRRQKPVEQGNPQLAELATELRELRARAGLTMQQLGSKAHYAKSRVSDAESGKKLPPWKLVEVYLREGATDPDVAAWRRRWDRLEKELDAERLVLRQGQGSSTARAATSASRNTPPPLDSPAAFLHDLRVVLGEQGVSLRAAARTAGCSVSTVSTTLNGGVLPRWERAEQLLRAANVTEHGLAGWRQRWQGLDTQQQAMGRTLAAVRSEATVLSQAAGSGRSTSEPADLPAQAALAEVVRRRYGDELRSLRIHHPLPLPVAWRTDEALSDHWPGVRQASLDANLGPLHLSGRYEQVAQTYLRVPSGRLVILGGPGSGKSVLVRQLAFDLLEQRAPGSPVPVVFSLSDWNPAVTSLKRWLAEELHHMYGLLPQETGFLRRMFRRPQPPPAVDLIEHGAVLPILDGFDEIDPDLRSPALEEINTSGMLLVVTSRSFDYAATRDNGYTVSSAAVIELQPLAVNDAINYLRRTTPPRAGRTKWDPVGHYLRTHPDSALAGILTNPLMVTLARQTYSDTTTADPVELTDRSHTSTEIENRLLDAVIPAAAHHFKRSAPQVESWLAYLAGHAEATAPGGLQVERLGASVPATVRRFLTWMLVVTCMIATIGVASVWTGDHAGRAIALSSPVLLLMFAGTYAALPVRRLTQHAGWRGRIWWPVIITAAIVVGGRAMMTVYDGATGIMTALAALMPMLQLDRWSRYAAARWAGDAGHLQPVTPRLTVATLRVSCLISVLMMLLWLWALVGVASSSAGPPEHRTVICGMVAGFLSYGLALTGWGQWLLTVRCWLPSRRQLPRRLLTFLEKAHAAGILRRQGPSYYFRPHGLQNTLVRPTRSQDRRPRSPVVAALVLGGAAAVIVAGIWAANIAVHALPTFTASLAAAEPATVTDTIEKVINIFSVVVGITAVVMIALGGLRYISSGGDSGKITGAKNTILYAVIGLVLVAMAQSIAQFVLASTTDSVGNAPNPGGLPGASVTVTIANGIMFFSLLLCLVGLILSAGLWAVGAFSNNYTQSVNGQKGFLLCAGAALAIGGVFFLVSWFVGAGQTVS